jgi:hypothetical protein
MALDRRTGRRFPFRAIASASETSQALPLWARYERHPQRSASYRIASAHRTAAASSAIASTETGRSDIAVRPTPRLSKAVRR